VSQSKLSNAARPGKLSNPHTNIARPQAYRPRSAVIAKPKVTTNPARAAHRPARTGRREGSVRRRHRMLCCQDRWVIFKEEIPFSHSQIAGSRVARLRLDLDGPGHGHRWRLCDCELGVGPCPAAGATLLDLLPDETLASRVRACLESGSDRVADLHPWRIGPGHCAAVVSIVSDAPVSLP
jgi:hypothetical protein